MSLTLIGNILPMNLKIDKCHSFLLVSPVEEMVDLLKKLRVTI